jgi:hypothetical protein
MATTPIKPATEFRSGCEAITIDPNRKSQECFQPTGCLEFFGCSVSVGHHLVQSRCALDQFLETHRVEEQALWRKGVRVFYSEFSVDGR